MTKAANKVIGGDYYGFKLSSGFLGLFIQSPTKSIMLDKTTVSGVQLITDEHRKSAKSGAARGIVGGALLGPVGMLAGGLSAKNKGIYHVALEFKDGKSSLVEVDDKLYKALMRYCF